MKKIVLIAIMLAVTLVSAQAPNTERALEKAFIRDIQLLTIKPDLICGLFDNPRCIEDQNEIVNNIALMFENKQYGGILNFLEIAEEVVTTNTKTTPELFWKTPFIFLIYIFLLAGE